MGFFKGKETFTIDAKSRVKLPAKMRKSISEKADDKFVVTRGNDECIYAYPMDEWEKYEEKFLKLNQYDEKNRYFLRVLLSESEEVSLDTHSRIMLPKNLTQFAAIESKVTIVGMMDHIEFWSPEKYDKYMSSQDESYEDVAMNVMSL